MLQQLETKIIAGHRPKPRPGDYMNPEDGLLYCGKCHEPRYIKVREEHGESIWPCLCHCDEEAIKKEMEDLERKRKFEHISRLREHGIRAPKNRSIRLESFDGEASKKEIARRYVEKWKTIRRDNVSLAFTGPGYGKIPLAAGIANALIDKEVPVLMTGCPSLLMSLSSAAGPDQLEILSGIARHALLILTDYQPDMLSAFSNYQQRLLFQVMEDRYSAQAPMIVITDLSLEELRDRERFSPLVNGINDRIIADCTAVYFSDQSRRDAERKKKRDNARSLLSGDDESRR